MLKRLADRYCDAPIAKVIAVVAFPFTLPLMLIYFAWAWLYLSVDLVEFNRRLDGYDGGYLSRCFVALFLLPLFSCYVVWVSTFSKGEQSTRQSIPKTKAVS